MQDENIFAMSIIYENWNGANGWNPTLWNMTTGLCSIFDIMVAHNAVTKGKFDNTFSQQSNRSLVRNHTCLILQIGYVDRIITQWHLLGFSKKLSKKQYLNIQLDKKGPKRLVKSVQISDRYRNRPFPTAYCYKNKRGISCLPPLYASCIMHKLLYIGTCSKAWSVC